MYIISLVEHNFYFNFTIGAALSCASSFSSWGRGSRPWTVVCLTKFLRGCSVLFGCNKDLCQNSHNSSKYKKSARRISCDQHTSFSDCWNNYVLGYMYFHLPPPPVSSFWTVALSVFSLHWWDLRVVDSYPGPFLWGVVPIVSPASFMGHSTCVVSSGAVHSVCIILYR